MKKLLTLPTKLLKRTLITFSILILIFFLTVSVRFYQTSNSKKNLHKSISENHWKDLVVAPTTVDSLGPPGAAIFQNLFLHKNDYLIAQGEDSTGVDLKSILNDQGNYHYGFKISSLNHLETQKDNQHHSKMLPGTTLILSSSDEMKSMQPHYFHFCEEFILAWTAYRYAEGPPIQTIIFPDIDNWEGRVNSISSKIIESIAPDAQVIGATQFKSLSKKYLLQFENAVFIDRHTCHMNAEVDQFNKMVIGHKPYIKTEYIREIRDSVLQNLKTYDYPTSKPYITYIMRNSTYRHLEPEFEKKLLCQIEEQFPDYRLNPVWFENYTLPEQLQIIRNTKVLIGAHGNGLTHQLFLPTDSLVLEIFPEDTYAMDYQLLSELSGHTYFGLNPKSGIVAKEGTRIPVRGDVNQVITQFDTTIVTDLIQDFTSRGKEELVEETLKETSLSE